MKFVTAEEAGKALAVIGTKLEEAGILTPEGRGALQKESTRIKGGKRSHSWRANIKRGQPISFARGAKDKNGNDLQINLICDLTVAQVDDDHPPFTSLDIAVEMHDLAGKPVGRWHVDRANELQGGPLYHLQFGGHVPGYRDEDFVVKEPRWSHPPMELALFCEVISANFYEPKWRKHLRDDPSWCNSIQLFQRLCFSAYAQMLQNCLNVSRSTALTQMWGDQWKPTERKKN
ncbi:hypothetical protein [Rhizobium sp. Leaf321]|uniref:hypothetical protein n=1 Tax=Rhizobium sp. Leaf321 TaxID=1736335 RepID=UPI0012E33F4C|nr:hypothetical protein [Rhizobium sp. Leaf321]